MQVKTEAKIPEAAATEQPLIVLDAAALSQVAGGGPNGGWAMASAAPASVGGPNGGWAVANGFSGPNGGW